MGRYILKASPEEDLYMEWTSICDAVTFVGTRKEMFDYLCEPKAEYQRTVIDSPEAVETRLKRCDETGTSGYNTGWNDRGLVCQKMEYYTGWPNDWPFAWLPRENYGEFMRRHMVDDEGPIDVSGVLEAIDPDE